MNRTRLRLSIAAGIALAVFLSRSTNISVPGPFNVVFYGSIALAVVAELYLRRRANRAK
jgi:hypothetical protein